jgi:hypothetical protein
MKPAIIMSDFYETESGFELFVGRAGQHESKKILADAWGAVLMDDGVPSVVLFVSFEKPDVEKFVKNYVPVELESCSRCYKPFVPSDDGGLCTSCKR